MPLVECPAPDPDNLATRNPAEAAARMLADGITREHEAFWLHAYHHGEGGYRQLGGGMVNLLRERFDAIESGGRRSQIRQRSAEFMSTMGLSMLLRTEAFTDLELTLRTGPQEERGSTELFLDIYTPDLTTTHAGPVFLNRLPVPTDESDAWYYSEADGGLYVHREQPPQPSSDALREAGGIFDEEFYDTWATLTPFPASADG